MKFTLSLLQSMDLCSINYNMRCIEIVVQTSETASSPLINYNMRCIEIFISQLYYYYIQKINYNMRCIEIPYLRVSHNINMDKLQHEMY